MLLAWEREKQLDIRGLEAFWFLFWQKNRMDIYPALHQLKDNLESFDSYEKSEAIFKGLVLLTARE